MLQPVMHVLNRKNIILATGSPRRQDIIKQIGLNVTLCPSLFEENLDPKEYKSFSDFVEETALQKVLEVEKRLKKQGQSPDIIIGADTMVALDQELIGKPKTKDDAFNMLLRLSGRGHTIHTGVVVKTSNDTIKFTESTDVMFSELDEAQIRGYIASGEPMDKAGAYGIQGIGGTLIKRVEGDYYNVVGLPLYRLSKVLYDLCKHEESPGPE